MKARSHERGHQIEFSWEKQAWVYSDSGLPIHGKRKCVRCGELPTAGGHDACLGQKDRVKYACCGHGVSEPYEIRREG